MTSAEATYLGITLALVHFKVVVTTCLQPACLALVPSLAPCIRLYGWREKQERWPLASHNGRRGNAQCALYGIISHNTWKPFSSVNS